MKYLIGFFALAAVFCVCADEFRVKAVYTRENGKRDVQEYVLRMDNGKCTFRLSAETVGTGVKRLEIIPSFATAKKGDAGYFLLPEGTIGSFKLDEGSYSTGEGRNYMPMYGMKTPGATFCAIAKKMSWRYATRVVVKDGVYRMSQMYNLNGDLPYEDFEIEFTFLPPDAEYPQMARVYRDWQLGRGAVKPIVERMKSQPELAAAATNVEIRIRQAWKPVPSPVPFQTKYNEPPVHAAVTFDRCGDIVRELKRQGVNHAQICLVGWNKGGHDGAYPQLFPVEPSLGGEKKLLDFIKLSNAEGFQTVCHTCFFSAYAIADDFDEEYLLKEKDGSLQRSHMEWAGGRPYRTCPQRAHERYTVKNMQIIKDFGFHGLHYHDVYSILPPRICYDPRHPCSPADSLRWYVKQMEFARDLIGGTQSEGPFDGFAGNLDYCMYVYFFPLEKDDYAKKPLLDRHVPLFQLVYNGIILSNPFTGTLNYPIKAPHKRLKFVEFGGRPLFVWYANFLTGQSNWMGKEDLVCKTDEELRAGVAAIKRGHDEYRKLSDLQFCFMDDHRMLTKDVSLTAYSNGTRIVVNHGTKPYSHEGVEVPAGDWRRFDAK